MLAQLGQVFETFLVKKFFFESSKKKAGLPPTGEAGLPCFQGERGE